MCVDLIISNTIGSGVGFVEVLDKLNYQEFPRVQIRRIYGKRTTPHEHLVNPKK